MKEQSYPIKRWFYLLLGTVTMLCTGTIYGWSVLKAPLAENFSWSPTWLALAYALGFCAFCLGNAVGGISQKKIGFRITLVMGGIAIFMGYFLMSTLDGQSILPLFIYFSFFAGAGTGLTYPILLAWITGWFPDMEGLCSGVLTMGFGCSALLLVKPASKLFWVPGIGWRGAYVFIGGCALGALLLCALFFKGQPETAKIKPKAPCAREFSMSQILRHPSYWILYIYLVFNSILGTVVIALSYDYCISLGFQPSAAATLVGLVSAFNGISRIIFGLLYDKLGRKQMMLVGSCSVSLSAAILLAATQIGSKLLAVPGLALAGFSYGYGAVLNPNLLRSFFGEENFTMCFSISNTRSIVGSMLNPVLTHLFVMTGSFAAPLTIALAASGVALVMQTHIKGPS